MHSSSEGATLKDLAFGEKQKVARLIKQVVEKEAAIKALEAALEAAGRGEDGGADCERLAEQNFDLARENTSLRAKLSHAFDLLSTYQHKCRTLEAAAAASACSHHKPPGPLPADDAGSLWAGTQPVTAHLSSQTRALVGTESGAAAAAAGEPAAHGGLRSGQLSPVAEGACEGIQPSCGPKCWPTAEAAQEQALAGPGSGCAPEQPAASPTDGPGTSSHPQEAGGSGGSSSLPGCQPALPQLETLKLLAQALMEAQAEVAAKQQQRLCAAGGEAPAALLATGLGFPGAGAPPLPLPAPALLVGGAVAAPGCAPQGPWPSCPPSPKPGSVRSECSGRLSSSSWAGSEVQSSAAAQPAGGGQANWHLPAHSLAAGAAGGSACSGDGWQGTVGPRCSSQPLDFDDSLMDLVRHVEDMGCRAGAARCWGAAAGQAQEAPATAGAGSGGSASGWLYEENDLLDLIQQL